MRGCQFLDEDGTFALDMPENGSALYFPLSGETGLKSVLTPNLSGDSKIDQNTFLLPPQSVENLHGDKATRNFWCRFSDGGIWSATGVSAEAEADKFTQRQDQSRLCAGLMWQSVERTSARYGIKARITSFVPVEEQAEVFWVHLKNIGETPRHITPYAAIPLYGRSADNLRDHRHVTSLLHRIKTTEHGVIVKPTLSFDERGHLENRKSYYVCGTDGNGAKPVSFYPSVEDWIGEGGSFLKPRALYENAPGVTGGARLEGREAMGTLRFAEVIVDAGEEVSYLILIGVTEEEAQIAALLDRFDTEEKTEDMLAQTRQYWKDKLGITFHTGDADFDGLMRWVAFQPTLRRLYGCSFLPHHDYGRGGRGWRDLWQDCLALLLMDPAGVGGMILDNFRGVRMDGTNATIIGAHPGEFQADRNGIARVWMDHGFWPYLTLQLYIDQTGDFSILEKEIGYFKDALILRGEAYDETYRETDGTRQTDISGSIYKGSVMEHILIQNLCAICECGEHGELRLRGADWNDALDMAQTRGESVAFTAAYAGNLKGIARLMQRYRERTGKETLPLAWELQIFLTEDLMYARKRPALLQEYMQAVAHAVSGEKSEVSIELLRVRLEATAEEMMTRIRTREWVTDDAGNGWFNSYYDDHGEAVEGVHGQRVRMMLTGQVFAIMSGTADETQIASVIKSADTYLYRKEQGGYRLNTDFGEVKRDLGRMFGFAYGEKENGAVFSHMAVMYAFALLHRGFADAGIKALKSLSDAALDFETSRIYPGIPEYFRGDGRGMYHYLTGAASWYLYTMLSEVFGVRGEWGDLVIEPRVPRFMRDENGAAHVTFPFAGRRFELMVRSREPGRFCMSREEIAKLDEHAVYKIRL